MMFRIQTPVLRLLVIGFFALTLAVVGGDRPAFAGEVFTVDRNDDPVPIQDACTAADNDDCSLRGAIGRANTAGSVDTVVLNADTYTLQIPGANEDLNMTGDLDILDSIILDGVSKATTIIDGGDLDRVIELYPGPIIGDVTISDLTIRDGTLNTAVLDGGAGLLAENGSVSLMNVSVTSNVLTGGVGGGIKVGANANASLTDVTVTDNVVTFGGAGGVFKQDGAAGSLHVLRGEVSGNTSDGSAGGLQIGISSSASLTDVTISGNTTTNGEGGGVWIGAAVVDISGGAITANHAPNGSGGGVAAFGEVHIDGTEISNNTATRGGGLITVNDDSTVVGALISGNEATSLGGGVALSDGAISDTTIRDNSANTGGGLSVDGSSTIPITHSAIFGNDAQIGGGVWTRRVNLMITNTTISDNMATVSGGGVYKTLDTSSPITAQGGPPQPASATLEHVTLAGNEAPSGANAFSAGNHQGFMVGASIIANPVGGSDCNVQLNSLGYNVTGGSSCQLNGPGDQAELDPLLGQLQDNGGATPTHALSQGSPAVDAVTAGCPPPNDDQRGVTRPLGTACDAGAFESPFSETPSPTPSDQPTASPTPTPTGGPTATPTSTPTGGAQQVIWGDHNCSGSVDPVDGLLNLRHDAGLPTETNECPDMGDQVNVQGDGTHPWGDLDCSGVADPVDGLKVLRFDAGLDVARPNDCPDPGASVTLG